MIKKNSNKMYLNYYERYFVFLKLCNDGKKVMIIIFYIIEFSYIIINNYTNTNMFNSYIWSSLVINLNPNK